jgi:hypothetical protein
MRMDRFYLKVHVDILVTIEVQATLPLQETNSPFKPDLA